MQLGWWDALVSVVERKPRHEIAWEAVKELSGDDTFDIRKPDADFERIDATAGRSFDYVIAGHTHLARALGRRQGHGMYFNSGTWATLMKLTGDQLASPEAFKPVFDRLETSQTIDALGNLVLDRPTAVTISANDDGQAVAALVEVKMEQGEIVLKELG
jgi:hypothetical protein